MTSDDLADLIYTSDTTGEPKGVMATHGQLLATAQVRGDHAGITHDDNYLITAPFFHSFGYKAGLAVCLVFRATAIPQQTFDPDVTMQRIQDLRVSVLPGPPTIHLMILEAPTRKQFDLSSLRLVVTGSSEIPRDLVDRLRSDLGVPVVLTAYGLTEAVVVSMCLPADDPATVASTAGRVVPGVQVKVHVSDATSGGSGEILVKGPNVMLGYFDDPVATSKAMDADGWLHTGDHGHLDARGYLTISGRVKDMVIVGGFNVYPAEVESVLSSHPDVRECAVVGAHDARLGQVLVAFVVPEHKSDRTADVLISHCRDHLANYKVPRLITFVEALPRSATGKIQKSLLADTDRQ